MHKGRAVVGVIESSNILGNEDCVGRRDGFQGRHVPGAGFGYK